MREVRSTYPIFSPSPYVSSGSKKGGGNPAADSSPLLRANAAADHGAPPPAIIITWRSVLDNVIIEMVASIFVNFTALAFANVGYEVLANGAGVFSAPWGQLVPSLATGLVMLTCKDEQFFPPDSTPTITLLLWSIGAYDSPLQAGARLLGHGFGLGVTLLLCCGPESLPPQALPVERPGGVVFGAEVVATAIEHFAIVYLCVPLLPTTYSHSARFKSRQGGGKQSLSATTAPSNLIVLQMALAFAVSHWCLRTTFSTEMNPTVSILKAVITAWQGQPRWQECAMSLWGQAIGLLFAIVYAVSFSPKNAAAGA